MRFGTLRYSVKQGIKNIARNRMFSIASIATMAACIFLFGIFFSIITNFNYIVEKAEEGVAIVVLFEEDATDKQVKNIGKKLEKFDGVLEVKYVSADSKRAIWATIRSWQKDLKTTIRWRILTTMRCIWKL